MKVLIEPLIKAKLILLCAIKSAHIFLEWIPCSTSVIKSELFPLHLSRNREASSSVAKDYKEALKIVQGVKKDSRGHAKVRAPTDTNNA